MKKGNCKICGKKIIILTDNKYCSNKCFKLNEKIRKAEYFKNNKEKCIARKNKWRKNNPERYKKYYEEYNRIWNEKNKDYHIKRYKNNKMKMLKQLQEWRKENPEKYKAHQIAIRIKMPENQLCVNCKKNKAIHRHHDDYSKPKKIKFLCARCHILLHKENKW